MVGARVYDVTLSLVFFSALLVLLLPPQVGAMDGACSSVNGSYITEVPVNTTLCANGVAPPNGVKVVGPDVTWTCYHYSGAGTDAYCMAHFVKMLPGTCGKARHQTFTDKSLMTNNNEDGDVCLYGTPSSVALVGSQFQWNCYGTARGAMVNCTAIYAPYSCAGHSEGSTWNQQVSVNDAVSKYCTYGAGNLSVVINYTVSLTCSGGIATVKSTRMDSITRIGTCAPVPTPTISVLGNWDTYPSLGGFLAAQKVRNDSIYADSSMRTPHGQGVARVSVSLGDDPIDSSGERAEVVGALVYNVTATTKVQQSESNTSGTVFYGLTYMFPTGFRGRNYGGGWSIICQLHGPDTSGLSPSVALTAGFMQAGGSLAFQIDGTGGFLPVGTHGSNPAFFFSDIDSEPIHLDRWVEFIMKVTFSVYTNGSVTLWRRNEGEKAFRLAADVRGATLQTINGSAVGSHYWKQGLYRQKGDDRTDTLFMGPFVRGYSFSEVETAAFGTSYGTNYVAPESDTFSSSATSSASTTRTSQQGGSTTQQGGSSTTTTTSPSPSTTSQRGAGSSLFPSLCLVTFFVVFMSAVLM